jgi:hypothetical protein
VVAGLLSPLPIMFLVGKSEASKLGLSFTAGPVASQPSTNTQPPLLRKD